MPLSLLLPLLAQVGPGGALPQAPLPDRHSKPVPRVTAKAPPAPVIACLAVLRTSPSEALTLAEQRLSSEKGAVRIEAAECKAAALASLGRWDEVEAASMAAHDLVPASEGARRARMQAAAAIAAEANGQRDRAIALFKAAHAEAVAAGDPVIAGGIARDQAAALWESGQQDAAMASLAEARAALPGDTDTWLISARASRKLKRFGEAQAQIEHAAALAPADPEIGLEAGVIAVLSGRDEAARLSWQSVIRVAPDSPEAKTAQLYLDQLGPPPAQSGK